MTNSTFPPKPVLHDPNILLPSSKFKANAIKCILAILCFTLVYIFLISFFGLAAYYSFFAGLFVIVNVPSLWGILIGAGIIITGALVLFFLFKFLFKRNKVDSSGMTLITEVSQPDLISFIHRVADEVGTSRPKKIYLIPDVNAFVFYNSNILSLFVPVRKNLAVGVGLINSSNLGEFKFILAHEFGHFSQRSMKLGSFVYQVNRIIFNLVGENDQFYSFIRSFGEFHVITYGIAHLSLAVIRLIQWVLQKMYLLVNLSYMGLSRQMEFHADTVAAAVAGSKSGIQALRIMELSEWAYQQTIQILNTEDKLITNLFDPHGYVLKSYLETVEKRLGNQWYLRNSEEIFTMPRSAITVKDQWASHPPTDERIANLKNLDIDNELITQSALCLFKEEIPVKEEITKKLINETTTFGQLQYTLKDFILKFEEIKSSYTYDPRYNNYYDYHNPWNKPIEDYSIPNDLDTIRFEDLFDEEMAQKPKKILEMENDIQTLMQIQFGTLEIKRFDYRGTKYKNNQAGDLVMETQVEVQNLKDQIARNDERIYHFFLQLAEKKGHKERYQHYYSSLKSIAIELENFDKHCEKINFELGRIQQQHSYATADSVSDNLVKYSEEIRKNCQELLDRTEFANNMTERDKQILKDFINYKGGFFAAESYIGEAFQVLSYCINYCRNEKNDRRNKHLKELLEFQLELANPMQPSSQ